MRQNNNHKGGNDMTQPYFAVDMDRGVVITEEGDMYSPKAFKTIIERDEKKDKFHDMTMMTVRFI